MLITMFDNNDVFYFSLFYYCLMTSAGGSYSFSPQGKDFRGFVIKKLRIFYHRIFQKTIKDKVCSQSLSMVYCLLGRFKAVLGILSSSKNCLKQN